MIRKRKIDTSKQVMNIVMWGPSGAGKDWLIEGFIRETAKINQGVENCGKKQDVAYFYNVLEYGGILSPAQNSQDNVPLTAIAESKKLEFVREFVGAERRKPYCIKHYHHVVIHNHRGGEMIQAVKGGDSADPAITSLFELENANFIVVLEPPVKKTERNASARLMPEDSKKTESNLLKTLSGNENTLGESIQQTYSMEEYSQIIKNFFNFLRNVNDKVSRNIAICLTKSDTHEIENPEPMTVLGQLYGPGVKADIMQEQKNHNIKIFLTTTEGFNVQRNASGDNQTSNDPKQSREEPADALLARSDRGTHTPRFKNPTNTASPFFWFFEEAEKERMKRYAPTLFTEARLFESNYYCYPKPEN
ncbi:MAG: hypothetical protein PHS75_07510 [Anaerolineaceae bacterium]|nr:hypothetical protein [Anaerolineaceae bacterium]MDD4578378.1 hypothetical protein [Anaerolineaceae bacterium]